MRFRLWKTTFIKGPKQQGATLITTLILVGLVLSITVGVARIVGQQIETSSDFFLTEKAYFGAESGVETALLELKNNPVHHGRSSLEIDEVNTVGNTKVNLVVKNFQRTINFSLDPNQSTKLRLKTHNGVTNLSSLNLSITGPASRVRGNLVLWGIQCQTEEGTISIQGKTAEVKNQNILQWSGLADDQTNNVVDQTVGEFWNQSGLDRQSCLLSLQNLSSNNLVNIVLKSDGMAPDKALVRSVGRAGNRQKIIEFEYLQNRLSAFFNFGFVHQDKTSNTKR